MFPYTIDAVRLLNRAGFRVVVVTSQNGVANGVLTEEFLAEAHAHLSRLFEAAGGKVEGYYYCPHSPTRRSSAIASTATAASRSPV